jgi:hypothetical protein
MHVSWVPGFKVVIEAATVLLTVLFFKLRIVRSRIGMVTNRSTQFIAEKRLAVKTVIF